MEKDKTHTPTGNWSNSNELEKTITVGIHGTPELKPDEKAAYLGEFKERVLAALTKRQVAETAIYPDIIQALQDKRAARMIISGDVNPDDANKYYQVARKYSKPYLIRHDQKYKGNIGLVVVGNDAVDVETIEVVDREVKLAQLGLPTELIHAAGQKICNDCYDFIEKVAPDELINYDRLTFIDRLTGEKCPVHAD
ncbi:YueI family protein [bacterium BFN5]|nr:YueI family protein [bacterium BFN5]QJW44806.1 YueI family protein [bacterium BFN5]